MLRGRIEYHGLSCLAMGSNSLTLADVRGYAFALWTHVDSSTTKTHTVVARRLNSSTRFSARMRPDEIPLQQVPRRFGDVALPRSHLFPLRLQPQLDMTVQRLHHPDPRGRNLWELRKRYQLVGRLECWVVGHLS